MKGNFKTGSLVSDKEGRMLKINDITETTYLYEDVASGIHGGMAIEYGNSTCSLINPPQVMMHTHSKKEVFQEGDKTVVSIYPGFELLEYNSFTTQILDMFSKLYGKAYGSSTCAKEDTWNGRYGEELAEARAWRTAKKNYLRFLKYMRSRLNTLLGIVENTIVKVEKDIEHNEKFIEKFRDGSI